MLSIVNTMTKKDIILLLSPSVLFVLIVVAAFFTSEMILERSKDNDHKQKFETFVSNVQSGKWQLTTDRWLDVIRREDATTEAYREASVSIAGMFRDFIWASVAGIFIQVIAVFSVLKRLRTPPPNTALDPTPTAP